MFHIVNFIYTFFSLVFLRQNCFDKEHDYAVTVASRPKILQNKSKPAVEKIIGRENLAPLRPPILDKSGRKAAEKLFDEKYAVFS
jgi:hypothetical protein